MEQIKIDSNVKKYQIVDENDNELGVIQIDTTDFSFFTRVKSAENSIKEKLQHFKDIIAEKNSDYDDKLDEIEKLDVEIKAQINYMFGSDVSSIVFGNKNCLSIGKGELFLERFMNAILPVIKQDIKRERAISEERIAKYTGEYVK
mgnify:FL=1|uniref:Uncharacterized protein n=1 Tax=Siphoviridae sp. ctLNL10 TaxID=2825453 RepID=A0A8S5Q3F3_9CAUD|nr:MAG TPA: hypothetical protein [Siphoviridae sp. ctLNL10]